MEQTSQLSKVSEITHTGAAIPVEIRVLNKWKPYHLKPTMSYLFVDEHGGAIQALFDDVEEPELDKLITVMNCYRVEAYKCIRAPSFMRVTTHPAAMQIDRSMVVKPIVDSDIIPRLCFDFITYEKLHARLNIHEVLTDYIGRVDRVTEVQTETRGALTKIMLEDTSDRKIEVTLWEEIGNRVDLQALTAADHHVIAAMTSLRVTQHLGILQLQSTAATCIHIDPDIDLARSIASRFNPVVMPAALAVVQPKKIHFIEKPSERKRRSIATLQNENPTVIAGTIYTCEASLVSFEEGRAWYYKACPKCNRKITTGTDEYTCVPCKQKETNYMYCVTGTIADHTGTATATIFGNAVASMVGISCYDMIDEHGCTDNAKIPDLMQSIKGVTKIFQLEKGRRDHTGLRFAVNKVFDAATRSTVTENTPPDKTFAMDAKQSSSNTELLGTKAKRELFKEIAERDPKKKKVAD